MQGFATKRDNTGVKRCPKCNADNLMEQDRCGKCGYVFPKSEAHVKKDKNVPFDFAGSINTQNQENEFGYSDDAVNEGEEEIQIPKSIPKTAKSEGPLTVRGAWTKCPRCSADLKWDSIRCSKCGYKPKKYKYKKRVKKLLEFFY